MKTTAEALSIIFRNHAVSVALLTRTIACSNSLFVNFSVKGIDEKLRIYTTRPDTLFGVTFMVMAPEHPLLEKYRDRIANKLSELEDSDEAMERLEKERESALLAVQQIPELVEQVNAYYDNEKARLEGQMALEVKAFNERQRQTEKTWKDYKDKALKALKTVTNAIKNNGTVMKGVMDKVVSLTKKGFSATIKIFTKL